MIMNRRDAETQRFFEPGFSKRGIGVRFRIVLLSLFVLCVSASLRFNQARAQTLSSETRKQINAVLDAPNLKEAHIGISILDLGTVKDAGTFPAKPYIGKPYRVLFERDANKSFMPASNMKLFTAAIALQLLGKEKTFPTRVFANLVEEPASPLLIVPQIQVLRLVGGGDPSFSRQDCAELAKIIAAHLPKQSPAMYRQLRVESDASAFGAETLGGNYPFGWTLDDTQWYYGPQISSLAFERNQLDVNVRGASKPGFPAKVDVTLKGLLILNLVKTVDRKATLDFEHSLHWSWRFHPVSSELYLVLEGEVTPDQVLSEGIALFEPSHIAAWMLQTELAPLWNAHSRYGGSLPPFTAAIEVAKHNSPPLKVLFQRFLKNSDNLYAEMLLRDAAYYYDGTGGDKAGPHAHALLKKWLIGQGIDITALRFEDGSGLSRYNLLTPRATSELLAAINSMKEGDVIWNALPIGGVDGTMKNRVKSTPAENNVRAKSGTFSIASNLSGYVTTRDHHRLAVALYMNFARDGDAARKAQDAVFAALANTRIQIAKPGVASHRRSIPAARR